MKTKRTNPSRLIVLAVLILPVATLAGVPGAGFDGMPTGPYMGPAVIGGDPGTVTVEPAANLGPVAPPGATGNVLVIDNSAGTGMVTVTFTYNCDGGPMTDFCEVEYDFFYEAWWVYAWIGVYVDDDGSYTNPDDLFEPPVGVPPTVSWGDNSEIEADCLGNHTITFVVSPGAVAYLDNFSTLCLGPIGNDDVDWGTLKSMYR